MTTAQIAIMKALYRENTARRGPEPAGTFRWDVRDGGLPSLANRIVAPLFQAALVTDDAGKLRLTATGRIVLRRALTRTKERT